MQTGIPGSPSGSKVVAFTHQVEQVLFDFPELSFVALRVGHPWERDFINLARNYPNLVLAADNPVASWPQEFQDLLRGKWTGVPDMTEQIVWGTNGPVNDPKVVLGQIDAMGLDPAIKARFIGGNAERLLKLKVPILATAGGR
jgi:predicted TIM-barrel fold metal-dependent hydrolase